MSNIKNNGYFFKEGSKSEVEKFVGIEEYATSKINGISGIYKESYKDFIVKEITSSGKILEIKENYQSQSFLERSKDKFTTFNLIKINKDTFEALRDLSQALRVSKNSFHYSGLKDKCSISVQKVSIKGNFAESLKKLKLRDIFIRSVEPTKKPVKLGGNKGNNFTIVIRNIENSINLRENVEKIFTTLSKHGFPNYFGIQRFGRFRPNSHNIGRSLMQNDYKSAFNEFISKIYSTESPRIQSLRGNVKNEADFERAFKIFPKTLIYERNMLKHMIDNPGDYQGALETLPMDLKNLLISAFQSYIFNRLITLRGSKGYSLFKPVKGDTISILDDENGHITKIKYIYGNLNGIYDKYLEKAIELNRAVIVVPIIGYNTNLDDFPLIKTLFEEIVQQENIDVNIFNNKFLFDFEFFGTYRAASVKPIGLKLIEISDDEVFTSKVKLKIEFSLNKGSYATLVLREIMK